MDINAITWWNNTCGYKSRKWTFWDPALTLNSSTPDLTLCFQHTVLTWIPCAFLLITGIPTAMGYVAQAKKFSYADKSRLNKAKLFLSLIIATTYALEILYYFFGSMYHEQPPAFLQSTAINFINTCFACWMIHREHAIGRHTSGVQQGYWTLQLVVSLKRLRSRALGQKVVGSVFFIDVLPALRFIGECLIWILVFPADQSVFRPSQKTTQTNEYTPLLSHSSYTSLREAKRKDGSKVAPSPESRCSFVLDVTFMWFLGYIIKGWKKTLQFEDLPDLPEKQKTRSLITKFTEIWNQEKERAKRIQKYWSIMYALALSIRGVLFSVNLVQFINMLLSFANPFLLRLLLQFIESNDEYTWKGLLIAFGILVMGMIQSTVYERYFFLGYNAGMNLRTMVTAKIYRKMVRLSNAARRQTTVGEVINLVAVDASKLEVLPAVSTIVWYLPIMLILTTYQLWAIIGPSCLAGIGMLVFIVLPLNGFWVGKTVMDLQGRQMHEKDKRSRVLNETLASIKLIKMNAWEEQFKIKIEEKRTKEVSLLRKLNMLIGGSDSLWRNTMYLVSFVIIGTYVVSEKDNTLDAEKVFVTFALVNLLITPLNLLPIAINSSCQGIVSLSRIQRFLLLDETEEYLEWVPSKPGVQLHIENASFSWSENQDPILSCVDLAVGTGKLIVITGSNGSGKSSLLSAIIGDMNKLAGNIYINTEDVAYVAQQSWVQNKTVRDNILFDKVMTPHYWKVLEACTLDEDLQCLQDGDLTIAGERGCNLSGGQRQRVSLARAVYQDVDLYLLDDPLSALDPTVAKTVFENVISSNGLLGFKTRVLVTNDETCIVEADEVYHVIDNQLHKMDHAKQKDDSSNNEVMHLNGSINTINAEAEPPLHTELAASMQSNIDLTTEKQQEGQVKPSIIWNYFKAGHLSIWGVGLTFYLVYLVVLIESQIWLSDWSNDVKKGIQSNTTRLSVYCGLVAIQIIGVILGAVIINIAMIEASKSYFHRMLVSLLHASMRFYDVTPIGRIQNRASKDIDYLDFEIPRMYSAWFTAINPLIATIFIISYTTPIILVAVVPICIVLYMIQVLYLRTGRQLRRIDSVRRSPVLDHFEETLAGLSTIRAFYRTQEFTDKFDTLIDESQRCLYHEWVSRWWLEETLTLVSSLFAFFAAIFAVLQRDNIGAGLAGLSVSFSLQFTTLANFFVRAHTELNQYMVQAERVTEYCGVQQESLDKRHTSHTAFDWPAKGHISFKNFSARYRDELPHVLKCVNLEVSPGEKLAIVGRTGAGKSSLSMAMFRILNAETGSILVDRLDICLLELSFLRSRITIIPQDVTIFSGTLRSNIDPTSSHSDSDIWKALDLIQMSSVVSNLNGQLDYECGDFTDIFSLGEKQLISIARAILRRPKILILDEATSGLDCESDNLVHDTVLKVFANCTVITIAHKIKTILDYDRVVVFDKGHIAESGIPSSLLRNEESHFHESAKNAGIIQ